MWLFTTIGFFSIVQKLGDDFLTVRARVLSDLTGLREQYMPNLNNTTYSENTDYPYRATISREEFSRGLMLLGNDIIYPNFKEAVSDNQGASRALIYSKVWSTLQDLNQHNHSEAAHDEFSEAYGGVVVHNWQVLLRSPEHQKGGYVWTFPKASPKGRETYEETAIRAVQEKTGIQARIINEIPGIFLGETTRNVYFLMIPENPENNVPVQAKWTQWKDVPALFNQTKTPVGKNRDLIVFQRAIQLYQQNLELQDLDTLTDLIQLEHNILCCAALRFDGYKYRDETSFNSDVVIRDYFSNQKLPEKVLDRLCLFFLLQRFLMKWGGEMLPRTHPDWKLFRILFIDLCNTYIPNGYRNSTFYLEWEDKFAFKALECKAIIQLIHYKTRYKS